eukprot:GILJ01013506.1.p1 GENE.GILJ01013506.1~~GILJ01013506.1.p1  ORF type:complete len:263 (-),score=80.07 GILJ01013506.1:174-962(-)
MSVTLFKDFHKETSDLLSKYYLTGGKWKVESKLKGGKDTVFVNPTATNDGVSADVEYKSSAQPISVKANVAPSGVKKVTVTYEQGIHKVEVASDIKGDAPEISYEQKNAKFTVSDKLTKKNAEAFASYKATDFLTVGAGATYAYSTKALGYKVNARFAQKGLIADVATDLKTISTGISYPLIVANKKVATAAEIVYGIDKKDLKAVAGAEISCFVFPKNALRFKVDNKLNAAVAYIAKLPGWTAAISTTQDLKFGLNLVLDK